METLIVVVAVSAEVVDGSYVDAARKLLPDQKLLVAHPAGDYADHVTALTHAAAQEHQAKYSNGVATQTPCICGAATGGPAGPPLCAALSDYLVHIGAHPDQYI